MRNVTAKALGLATALLAAASCADSQSVAPTAAASASLALASGTGPPPAGWSGMSRQERRDYMRMVVMPKVKELFVAFDPARYGKMSCATCHGEGANDATFKMPNPKLAKLPPSPEGFRKLIAEKPAVCQFMLVKLKPTVAALLGLPAVTPDTPTGFGCRNCHEM